MITICLVCRTYASPFFRVRIGEIATAATFHGVLGVLALITGVGWHVVGAFQLRGFQRRSLSQDNITNPVQGILNFLALLHQSLHRLNVGDGLVILASSLMCVHSIFARKLEESPARFRNLR
jgi:hypothetical protein